MLELEPWEKRNKGITVSVVIGTVQMRSLAAKDIGSIFVRNARVKEKRKKFSLI
ncbi:hypothetical protein KDJ21_018885 [Metabacillus litoralis]|uniref:hypothetical protein n=1 Tax=Metabacillus litoralis TaxID=152268 RepID=UPI001E40C857|nr:hypothetical protein [Metabacillus litoralis]UHA58875.1 hypothetical protein KDJ21_018885 [Metabacillus litoralis]